MFQEPGPSHCAGAPAPPDPREPKEIAAVRSPTLLLTIAGFDPSSGAGLTADLKVFAAHGFMGLAAATALTVQSTRGVRRVQAVGADLLRETLACLAEDAPLAGIKIGMLATEENVRVVASWLASQRGSSRSPLPVVLDPVLRSTSGKPLLAAGALACLREELLPLVTCVTPNVAELGELAGLPEVTVPLSPIIPSGGSSAPMHQAAARLMQALPGLAVIATGGHLPQPDDCVYLQGCAPHWIRGAWVRTAATHGTGCAYASAVLCGLVAGLPVVEAATAAKAYVTGALRAARPYGGGGAMYHLYRQDHSTVFASEKQAGASDEERAATLRIAEPE